MNKSFLTLLTISFLVLPFIAYGQESQPSTAQPGGSDARPAGDPQADAGEFVVIVVQVAGTVEVQPGGQGDWVSAVVGMRFGEGTNVCTGFKSGVILEFTDSGVVMLKDLAQARIDKLFKDANAVDAELNLTVGRVGVYVKKQEIRSEFRVVTPRLTAAVKGSYLDAENTPDYGVFVREAYGDITMAARNAATQSIGESITPAEELRIVANRVGTWNADCDSVHTGKDLATMVLRQLGYRIDEKEWTDSRPTDKGQSGRELSTEILRRLGHDMSSQDQRETLISEGTTHTGERGGYVPGGVPTWFLAEGSSSPGFSEFVTMVNPATANDNAISSGLPQYSGSQFSAQCDQLYAMGYSGLAYYLRNDGATCPAVSDVMCFIEQNYSNQARLDWMWGVVDSSQYASTLREAYGGSAGGDGDLE